MYRFLQIATLSMIGVFIIGGPLSDLDLPKVSGWKLPDGKIVFHEFDLINAGIECDLIMCAYPVGTTSRCDNGKLFAATGGMYDLYATEPGVIEISYSPVTETVTPIFKANPDG